MSTRDERSQIIRRFFSDQKLEANLDEEVHGRFYTTNELEVHLFIPKDLSYIQLYIDFHALSDDDVSALPIYCMAENVHDEGWPRRVFGIDPERRMIVYLQVFPVSPDMQFAFETATEDLSCAAQRHISEIGTLLSSIGSGGTEMETDMSGSLIFKA